MRRRWPSAGDCIELTAADISLLGKWQESEAGRVAGEVGRLSEQGSLQHLDLLQARLSALGHAGRVTARPARNAPTRR